jgi:hypothetical protein
MNAWEAVLLPDPDSPTMATILPRGTEKLMPRTAGTVPFLVE